MSLPSQEQGESITYTPDGRALLVSSEGDDRKVWRVPLPERALPSPTRSGSGGNEGEDAPSAREGDTKTDGSGSKNGLGLFIVVGAVVAATLYSRRRK
jgi:hypothetical protein